MNPRSTLFGLFLAAALILGTGTATAERQFIVSGMLDYVDREEQTVVVGRQKLQIGPLTAIKDAEGNAGGWDELEAWDGDDVDALVVQGFPNPRAQVILLSDEDDAEE